MSHRIGHCFSLAGTYIIDHGGAVLVHGTVRSRSPTSRFQQLAHAWVKEEEEVYDLVFDLRLPWDAYQRLYDAQELVVYSRLEARDLMLQSGHFGPWSPRMRGKDIENGRGGSG